MTNTTLQNEMLSLFADMFREYDESSLTQIKNYAERMTEIMQKALGENKLFPTKNPELWEMLNTMSNLKSYCAKAIEHINSRY